MRRNLRWLICLAVASMAPVEAAHAAPRFREVGRVALLGAPELDDSLVGRSGWLIVNPLTRRGYQVFEAHYALPDGGVVTRTILQSFDLDTLEPRRRALLSGAPITGGTGGASGVYSTSSAGDVVHAVDQQAGRIYLALSHPEALENQPKILLGVGFPPDKQRPLSRFLAIDEAAFDRGDAAFAASFREPPEQAHLHDYWLVGMAVSRHHVAANEVGRLVLLFAQPQAGGSLNPVPVFDHTLANWDPSGLEPTEDAALATDPGLFGLVVTEELASPRIAAAGPSRRLDVCALAPIASPGSSGQGNHQWGLLATRSAIWTACSGAVVRSSLDDNGFLQPVGGQERHALALARTSDVLVDEGAQRLLIRSWGNGHVWTVFDTATSKTAGFVQATGSDFLMMASGVDSTTGRLYQLLPDHTVGDGQQGTSVEGGLQHADTRATPVPTSLTNVRPDLASAGVFRIQVDPVTRRFFVRRGTSLFGDEPAEPFYRVFEDRAK